jgi:hypothetical protein
MDRPWHLDILATTSSNLVAMSEPMQGKICRACGRSITWRTKWRVKASNEALAPIHKTPK